uniref:Uncharacterized protein n=1 Tax=Timema poppense TaxID=170557 RepID=A0A7R9CI86_TIMPO|nr:unnamed protein product [Timema poppensis]
MVANAKRQTGILFLIHTTLDDDVLVPASTLDFEYELVSCDTGINSQPNIEEMITHTRAAQLDSFRLHYNARRRRSSSQHQHSTEPELLTSSPGVWLSSPSPTTPPKWKTVTTTTAILDFKKWSLLDELGSCFLC